MQSTGQTNTTVIVPKKGATGCQGKVAMSVEFPFFPSIIDANALRVGACGAAPSPVETVGVVTLAEPVLLAACKIAPAGCAPPALRISGLRFGGAHVLWS